MNASGGGKAVATAVSSITMTTAVATEAPTTTRRAGSGVRSSITPRGGGEDSRRGISPHRASSSSRSPLVVVRRVVRDAKDDDDDRPGTTYLQLLDMYGGGSERDGEDGDDGEGPMNDWLELEHVDRVQSRRATRPADVDFLFV